jgi:hypothetical protein
MTGEIQADPILSALSWYGPQESPGALLNIFLAKPPRSGFLCRGHGETLMPLPIEVWLKRFAG